MQEMMTAPKDLGNGMLMIEHHARKVPIDAIVHVEHVGSHAGDWILQRTTGNHIARKLKCLGHIVPTWFTDDADLRREIEVQTWADDGRHHLKCVIAESTPDIQRSEVVTDQSRLIEHEPCIFDGLDECVRVRGARADVEADANDAQIQVLGEPEQRSRILGSRAKLQAQSAKTGRVVGEDAEVQLRLWKVLLDLVELFGVVKGHLLHLLVSGIANERIGLAGLSVDDASRVDAHVSNLLNLLLGRTVEASSQLRQESKHSRIRITFNR